MSASDTVGGARLGPWPTALVILGLVICVVGLRHATAPPQVGSASLGEGALLRPAPPLPRSEPFAIDIPAIRVAADVVPEGLDADGSLTLPPLSLTNEAGWYRDGVTPGERGTAVIAGHVDTTTGPSVFYRLGALRPGQVVRVHRADGSIADFTINAIEQVPKSRFPADKIYGPTDYPSLRLVTCGGSFDHATGHYLDNVIVYAILTGHG